MNTRKVSLAISIVAALSLSACGMSGIIPPTPTSTPAPTPTPSGVIVTPVAYGGICLTVLPEKTMDLRLVDEQGTLVNSFIEIQGEICGDSTGITLDRNDNVLRILSEVNGTWYKITHTEIVDGLLLITAEDGLYPAIMEGRTLTPVSREVKPAVIAPCCSWRDRAFSWKGEASFIITGLNTNYAIVYQDTRNYDIQR